MFLERLRAKVAHLIAPEVRERHRLAVQTVQDNCMLEIQCANRIKNNFNRAVDASNGQTEELYADAFLHLPDKLQRKWVSKLGAPQLHAPFHETPHLTGIEVTEYHDRSGI